MKTKKSFQEKALLSSFIIEEDCLDSENITNEINNSNTPKDKNIQNYGHSFFESNFSNQNNSFSELNKAISYKLNDAYKEKEVPNLQNNLFYSKSLNPLLIAPKQSFFENVKKFWSEISTEKKDMNQSPKIAINDKMWNINEIKDINDANEFLDSKTKEDMKNGNNGILNDFTRTLNDINHYNLFIDKNNKNINGRTNYDLKRTLNEQIPLINNKNDIKNNSNIIMSNNNIINNYISLNNDQKIFLSNINYLKYTNNTSEKNEENKNNEIVNIGNYIFSNIQERNDFLNFRKYCEKLKVSLADFICSKEEYKIILKCSEYNCALKIDYLINQLYIDFERIICNKYGNYFFQKLYMISQKNYRIKILNLMKDYFITVSKNEIGMYTIQRIIEVMTSNEERKKIINYLNGHELEMSLDKEGTHLIQSIIKIFPEEERQNLTNILCKLKNIKKLLKNENGVNIIKRLIEHNKTNFNRNKLIQTLYLNIYKILDTSNGCYIIYYLIQNWGKFRNYFY